MADWTNIPDTAVDPDAPITSELGYAFRDNVIAVTEGAIGAPRITDAALNTTATTAGRDWVVSRYLMSGLGGVGSFAMLSEPSSTARAPGFTSAGANLYYDNAGSDTPSSSPAGTWMLMGRLNGATGSQGRVSIWQRIS